MAASLTGMGCTKLISLIFSSYPSTLTNLNKYTAQRIGIAEDAIKEHSITDAHTQPTAYIFK
jgi:hypothetical protein